MMSLMSMRRFPLPMKELPRLTLQLAQHFHLLQMWLKQYHA